MGTPSMSTANYGQAVKKFTDAGIHPRWLIPIAPVGAVVSKTGSLSDDVLGKAPGRFNEGSGKWSGLGGRAIVDGVSKAEFTEFSEWPTPNAGVLGRAYPGIDSDAENDDARRLVVEAMHVAFDDKAEIGVRLRGTGSRRLYAFKCVDPKDEKSWVRTRHISYELKDGSKHKLDVIGYGGQYVVTGTHPSGNKYEWHETRPLTDSLTAIDNADMERFITAFQDELERQGGQIIRASGGGGTGDEIDIRDLDPVMDLDTVLEGLNQLPNSPDTFENRDDFVSALAAIRAALGKESRNREVENAIYDWATKDPEWCDEEYFEKIWRSLDRVRVGRDSLDRLFRRNGIKSHVKHSFDNNAPRVSTEIRKHKDQVRSGRDQLLDTVSQRYIFGYVNTREQQGRVTMRDQWNVEREWPGYEWWKSELPETDKQLLAQLHEVDGYSVNKVGFANFCRDMQVHHPEVWYSGETRHPAYEKGEIVAEEMPDGNVKREVNMRYLSPAIRAAKKKDKNPKRSQEDVSHILDFVYKLFGPMAKYELDTLAYMAQTGDRPGSLLFIVGDQGVGKSIWLNMQMSLFDGVGPEQGIIDGAKLMNENSRRFILAKTQGSRILSIRELPEGGSARDLAALTSMLKQVVDPGPEGDFITVERKGQDAHPERNHARVLISSNYANAIHIEQQDRRIFYVSCQITLDNKPDEDYYSELVEITRDPERLAAFWRYLLSRDVTGYTRYSEPPISVEKMERIIAEITNPAERHMRAAIQLLKSSGRTAFGTDELAELMTKMARNEYVNSAGAVDDRQEYAHEGKSSVHFMNGIRMIRKRMALKVERVFRTSKVRYPSVYVMADQERLLADMMTWDRQDVFDYIETDERKPFVMHPWTLYRDPT